MLRALRESGRRCFCHQLALGLHQRGDELPGRRSGRARTKPRTGPSSSTPSSPARASPRFSRTSARRSSRWTSRRPICNTDDGAPMSPIGASEAEDADDAFAGFLRRDGEGQTRGRGVPGRFLQTPPRDARRQQGQPGAVRRGSHLRRYDAFQKTLGWRTMLVVPELQHELRCLEARGRGGSRRRNSGSFDRDATRCPTPCSSAPGAASTATPPSRAAQGGAAVRR